MPQPSSALLEPRKSPVQARSAASVTAILEATIQVLLQVGKERLTTTKVALRAGVSVGTLYQYFPNKSSLLKAALRHHMDEVADAVELVCQQQERCSLAQMATALITAFLEAKMRDIKSSVALYSVSSDVDGAQIVEATGIRVNKAVVAMLKTACEPLTTDPQLVASILQAAMAGVSRRLLESPAPEKQFETLRQELIFLACAYVDARSGPPLHVGLPSAESKELALSRVEGRLLSDALDLSTYHALGCPISRVVCEKWGFISVNFERRVNVWLWGQPPSAVRSEASRRGRTRLS